MRRKQADTAFSEFWEKRGNGIATTYDIAKMPSYQLMKITFYWGWHNRGIQERKIAKLNAQSEGESL